MTARSTVLITDSGTGSARSALAAVRAAARAGYSPIVGTSGAHSLAAASRRCAGVVRLPPAAAAGFADAVRAEIADKGHVAVLPSSDAALMALEDDVLHLIDKARLAARAGSCGLAVPDTHRFEDVHRLARAVARGTPALPLVVKPVISTFPARLVRTRGDLEAVPDGTSLVAQPLLDGPLRAVSLVVHAGRPIAAVEQVALRTWPATAGTSSFAVTVEVDEERLARIAELAGPYQGILQVQFVAGRVIDANPRVFGSLPLALAAGVNLVGVHLAAIEGRRHGGASRGRPGVRYRWTEGDLRHVATAVASRRMSVLEALGALRPRHGTVHSVEAVTDPGPLLARLRFVAGRR